MKKKILLKNAYETRKEQSKHILQKIRTEKFLDIKFENEKEYLGFLDILHKPYTFEQSREIIGDVIRDQINEGADILSIIKDFKGYVDNYVEKHKKTNGNVEDDDDIYFVEGMMYECLEDGMREIGNLEEVTTIMFEFLYEQYLKYTEKK